MSTIMSFRKLFAFPTWVTVRAILPLMANNHPMVREDPTFEEWVEKRTPLAKSFDAMYWISILLILIFAI